MVADVGNVESITTPPRKQEEKSFDLSFYEDVYHKGLANLNAGIFEVCPRTHPFLSLCHGHAFA